MTHGGLPPESDPDSDDELSRFSLNVTPGRDRVFVCPSGEVDLATAGKVEAAVVDLLERGFHRVVVDLRAVTFLDSTGIHALITVHERARQLGETVSVILGGPATRRALELTGLVDHLNLEHDAERHP